jgi:hypothetical protein
MIKNVVICFKFSINLFVATSMKEFLIVNNRKTFIFFQQGSKRDLEFFSTHSLIGLHKYTTLERPQMYV